MLRMLSEHKKWISIAAAFLAALCSVFLVAPNLPQAGFVQDSLQSLEDSSDTVMKFSAATLSTSLAISALPDDFATPLAENLANMNGYFVVILVALFLEKLLIQYGITAAFRYLIPAACGVWLLSVATKKELLKGVAARICILGLTVAFVVPLSTGITGLVGTELTAYVGETIEETEDGAGKLGEAMEEGGGEKTIFEKLSDLFETAVNGISDLMTHFQDTIRRCLNSIAILILTNCLMPLLTVFVLKWVLEMLFQIVIPMPSLKKPRSTGGEQKPESEAEFAAAGGKKS